MAKVRYAELHDVADIVELGVEMHAESPRFAPMDFNRDKVAALITRLIDLPIGCVLVVEEGGKIIGMLGGVVSEQFFGASLTASDFAWFVSKPHRIGAPALKLLSRFEQWAAERGAFEVAIGVGTGVHADKTKALLGRWGYEDSGTAMTKRLTHV
ncbi:hypothetical protein UFOVP1326_50 [uncultured Caudovirales phage]|uniref:N-acetyltransferase domain-containing protein n=1 Tax=uncultured Caudovirales phage TaxID=2100421 RepID=A0A6J5SGF8_9CAUD|nr:hypothetical protein UFOVP1326_50 [uncultured Caudovirales phage]CAB4212888.1 hypothetical protein UFOVP1436_41 [uncultured Caudovirales phage]